MTESVKEPETLKWAPDAKIPDGGVLGAVLTVVAGILYLRRRVSADTKAIKADGQETKFVDTLLRELEDARAALAKASEEKAAMTLEIGGLRERVRHLDESNARMAMEFDELKDRLKHFERVFSTLKIDAFQTAPAPFPHEDAGTTG